MRESPSALPIESKVTKEESTSSTSAGARAERIEPVNPRVPPNWPTLRYFAHHNLHLEDEALIRKFWDEMNDQFFWCYPKTGEPMRHWPAFFKNWLRHEKPPRPEGAPPRRHGDDNWRPGRADRKKAF